MFDKKIFYLNPISVDTRKIIPIALLKVSTRNNIFYDIHFETIAIKIVENDLVYFKNINLSQNEFDKLVNLEKK